LRLGTGEAPEKKAPGITQTDCVDDHESARERGGERVEGMPSQRTGGGDQVVVMHRVQLEKKRGKEKGGPDTEHTKDARDRVLWHCPKIGKTW